MEQLQTLNFSQGVGVFENEKLAKAIADDFGFTLEVDKPKPKTKPKPKAKTKAKKEDTKAGE
ncbi:hypothetical protein [Geomicrobium sp. JCM 19055]|uniref:hypothetical protein n=1 Tax=Geomicrobium sp. JCM 19055 TaxID=1460649 RepID=UPI00045ED392|nr:hypothetical protein [Geomicrobium sp. JCM 19055]GAK00912.1 hypothetical protein JCM19055_4037 [Geomicrobium sp. JCM 19055]